jgi:hypothetical protein
MKLPQLTLRDLFWLVLVCALAVGWWNEHSQMDRRAKVIADWHEELEGYAKNWERNWQELNAERARVGLPPVKRKPTPPKEGFVASPARVR